VLTVEEAREQILSRVQVLPAERVALLGALDRVLAEPVVATREIPPWPNSSMDGYAVRAADTRGHGPRRLTVVGRVAAGAMPEQSVGPGQTIRIFTGAPLPAGADAVIPQEDVEVDGPEIVVSRAVDPHAFVRPRGEDVRPGDPVLFPGQVIGAAEVGLLATLGWPQVRVHRRPRVAILSTGNELADLGREPGPGQIPNTNSYTLMAQAREAGGEPINLGVAADLPDDIEQRLGAIEHADVLVSSAGVSVGDHDFVRAALEKLGAELHLWRVSMRPGKPITFGTLRGRPLFGLPGNPVSAMVTFELFVRPALRKMLGHAHLDRLRIVARAAQLIENPGQRRGYLRVTLTPEGDHYAARLTGEQGSAILRSMVLADGFAVVPGDAVIEKGDAVEVIVLKPLTALQL
jgi:molybdopterin molybdotransferase